MSDREWWEPTPTDPAWVERVRSDYPEACAGHDDEWVRDKYANGRRYGVLWDHIGDAYEQFEALADAYLAMKRAAREEGTR